MTPDPVGGALTKEAAGLTVKAASWGIQYFHQWYRSYSLLILGQERSGKTTLYEFFKKRLLGERGRTTKPTIDNVDSGIFALEWKTAIGAPLLLEFRNVGDRAGQIGPYEHARMLVRNMPHIVVVVLDMTSPAVSTRLNESYAKWFEAFAAEVAETLLNRPKKARKVRARLHQMIVLLNKVDELDPGAKEATLSGVKAELRKTMQGSLRPVFGSKVDHFPILPCSMVGNPLNGTEADTLTMLRDLLEELARGVK